MEQNINIAALLKDCPKGTKLYSPICGECEYESYDAVNHYIILRTVDGNDKITFTIYGVLCWHGLIYNCSECLLFPSKDNRDWSTFKAPQKEQPKFKVGDVVIYDGIYVLDDSELKPADPYTAHVESVCALCGRLATPEEIAKWNKETLEPNHLHYDSYEHKIVDWFNPKDDVLVRNEAETEWRLCTFSHRSSENGKIYYCASGSYWSQCLPYNEKTAKLIGTTNDYEEE